MNKTSRSTYYGKDLLDIMYFKRSFCKKAAIRKNQVRESMLSFLF